MDLKKRIQLFLIGVMIGMLITLGIIEITLEYFPFATNLTKKIEPELITTTKDNVKDTLLIYNK